MFSSAESFGSTVVFESSSSRNSIIRVFRSSFMTSVGEATGGSARKEELRVVCVDSASDAEYGTGSHKAAA